MGSGLFAGVELQIEVVQRGFHFLLFCGTSVQLGGRLVSQVGDFKNQGISVSNLVLNVVEFLLEFGEIGVGVSQLVGLGLTRLQLGVQRGNLGDLQLEFISLLFTSGQRLSQSSQIGFILFVLFVAILEIGRDDQKLIRSSLQIVAFSGAFGEIVRQRFVLSHQIGHISGLSLQIIELFLESLRRGFADI